MKHRVVGGISPRLPGPRQLSFADLPNTGEGWKQFPGKKGFLPPALPQIGDAEIEAVTEALKSGQLDWGPKIGEFEKRFAGWVGSNFAVATSSCTQGMRLSLEALGLKAGDEVIIPSLTWVGTATAVVDAGATPVFVDIDGGSFNIDPSAIKEAITPRTKAMIPVHFAGSVADLTRIFKIADEHGLAVVQDAAQALGSEYNGRRIGMLNPRINTTTVFSFCPTKNLTTGGGGMVTTGHEKLALALRVRSRQGVSVNPCSYSNGDPRFMEALLPGCKSNLTSIQAAIGLAQMERLDQMLTRRRGLACYYRESFSGLEENGLLRMQDWGLGYDYKHSFCYFPILIENPPDFIREMGRAGVGTGYLIAIHLHRWYGQRYGLRRGMLPNSESVSDRLVSLPLYPLMTDQDAERVVETVHSILQTGHPTIGGVGFPKLEDERRRMGVSGDDIPLLQSLEKLSPVEKQQITDKVNGALAEHLSNLKGLQPLAIANVKTSSLQHISVRGIDRRFDVTDDHDVTLLNEILRTLGSKKRLFCTTHHNAPFVFAYGEIKERQVALGDRRHIRERFARAFTFLNYDVASPSIRALTGETANETVAGIFRESIVRGINGRATAMFFTKAVDTVLRDYLRLYGVSDINQYFERHGDIFDDIEEGVRAHQIGHLSHSLVCDVPERELYDFRISLNRPFTVAGESQQDFLVPSLAEALANLAPQGLYQRALEIAKSDPQRAYRVLSAHRMLLQGYEIPKSIPPHPEMDLPFLDSIIRGGPANIARNLERLPVGGKLFDELNAVFMGIHQFHATHPPDKELLRHLKSKGEDVRGIVKQYSNIFF